MSQENVEIVGHHLEAFLSGDNETALSYYDPEVEFDATARPEGQVYRGHEGVAEAMRVWVGAWEDWKFEVQEIIDAGDRVLLIARESGRGKGSGIEIDQPNFIVFTLRDGKIVRWQGFVHRDAALEAAGLRD
jgi:ketosteroid isomerase-like protein